jgi:hypothetical protein
MGFEISLFTNTLLKQIFMIRKYVLPETFQKSCSIFLNVMCHKHVNKRESSALFHTTNFEYSYLIQKVVYLFGGSYYVTISTQTL